MLDLLWAAGTEIIEAEDIFKHLETEITLKMLLFIYEKINITKYFKSSVIIFYIL